MDNEKDLSSPNFGSTAGSLAGAAMMTHAAKSGPKWQRYLMIAFAVITAADALIGLGGKLSSIGSLPACDAQTTRDTLSDLNRENKFNASKYNFIKNVSTSESEVKCVASLALRGGAGDVEYDYRIYSENGKIRVQITSVRR